MTPGVVSERAGRITLACADAAGRADLVAGLAAAEQLRAWLDARTGVMVQRLAVLDSFPERTIADTSRCSLGTATKTKERAETLADTPTLAGALDDGAITAGHIDAVTKGRKRLDSDEQREAFIERVEALADVAAASTIEQFGRRLDLEIKKLQTDDGEERLTRQRRQTRVSTWVDDEGMWNLRGRFDPVTGMRLATTLDRAADTLFVRQTPEHCPLDPVEKSKFLMAHALAHLLEHGGAAPGTSRPPRPEFVVVIDVAAGDQTEVTAAAGPPASRDVEWPIPVEVPERVLAELFATADVHTVVVRNGVVLHAPGNLDLGRSTRLASRAQRRALRAMYRCCAVPGCTVQFDRLEIHHVIWWRHGGRTDLSNLLPICSAHHSKIHDHGWSVTLGPHRELTITLPDGRTMANGPPRRSAA